MKFFRIIKKIFAHYDWGRLPTMGLFKKLRKATRKFGKSVKKTTKRLEKSAKKTARKPATVRRN